MIASQAGINIECITGLETAPPDPKRRHMLQPCHTKLVYHAMSFVSLQCDVVQQGIHDADSTQKREFTKRLINHDSIELFIYFVILLSYKECCT